MTYNYIYNSIISYGRCYSYYYKTKHKKVITLPYSKTYTSLNAILYSTYLGAIFLSTSIIFFNNLFFNNLYQSISIYGRAFLIITFIWNLYVSYIIFTNSVNSNTNSNSNSILDYIKGLIQTIWSNKAFLMKVSFIAIPLISLPRYLLFAKLHQAGFILDFITFIYISITMYPIIIFIFNLINLSLIQGSAIFNKNTFNVILNNTRNHLNVKSFTMYLFFILFYKYFLFYILVICISGETLYLSSNDDTTRDWQNRPVVVAESSSMAANRGVSNTTNTGIGESNTNQETPNEILFKRARTIRNYIHSSSSGSDLANLNSLSTMDKDLISKTVYRSTKLGKAIRLAIADKETSITTKDAVSALDKALSKGPGVFDKQAKFLSYSDRLYSLGNRVSYTGNNFNHELASKNKMGAFEYLEKFDKRIQNSANHRASTTVEDLNDENFKTFTLFLNARYPKGNLTKMFNDWEVNKNHNKRPGISPGLYNALIKDMNECPIKDFMLND